MFVFLYMYVCVHKGVYVSINVLCKYIYMTIHNYVHVDMHMYVYYSPQNLNLRNQRKNQLLNSNSKQLKTEQH